MPETEPQNNRESQSNEPENAAEQQNSGHEGGLRRGLLRRGRRAVSRPAGPPTFMSGAAGEPGQDAARSRRSGQDTGAGAAVPVVPAVPGVPLDQPTRSQPASAAAIQPPVVLFQPPELSERPAEPARTEGGGSDDGGSGSRRRRRGGRGRGKGGSEPAGQGGEGGQDKAEALPAGEADSETKAAGKRGEGAGKPDAGPREDADAASADGGPAPADEGGEGQDGEGSASSRRRRRRRQRGGTAVSGGEVPALDEPADTVVHVREPRSISDDDVRAVKGSTRLEAKRQRRREGRDTGRRRPPIISESEFLARREAVERMMVVRQRDDRTQIAVLEDGVLVEHYVDRASHQSYVGNVYLGKVQNVLPSMEAAFVDIGKGRNAVLYAGEVNFDASGLEGVAKRIESALKSGQSIMVQVTKDPIGHKGARLTSQVSLPGRYLVYVPGASMTGISRKLPDTERNRLKQILKKVAPEEGGIIVRTAAEGASEEELQHDVTRLVAQWQAIERKAKTAGAPELLYGEPDLTIRVVRDIFNEDFTKLVIASDSEWDLVDEYVRYVAPNLADRLQRWTDEADLFSAYRIDEQLTKALDRKVWLPSGGSLVIDTTEAMTVIDVNTGKFTGQGGNLEQTVTRNNLEAAEEIVRQLRLRDIGGIIVIDFIDMVLESNRDLVLRRLIECLARDRTKHQVAEVTSLGLVQMTRKRVGSGLLAAFSAPCEHCGGRGILVSAELTELPHQHGKNGQQGGSARSGQGRSRSARSKAAIAQVAKSIEPGSSAAETVKADEAAAAVEAEAAVVQAGGGSPDGEAPASHAANGASDSSSQAKGERRSSGSARSGRGASARQARAAADAGAAGRNGRAPGQEPAVPAAIGEPAADGEAAADGEPAGDGEPAVAAGRRPRRSAHRAAGPPDPALAAASSGAPTGSPDLPGQSSSAPPEPAEADGSGSEEGG